MSDSISIALDTLKEIEEMLVTELADNNIIDTPINRHELLTEICTDLEKEMPDSMSKRAMMAMFGWFLENLLRESRFEDLIPVE